MKKLVILTGASGSGKTAALNTLKEKYVSAEQPVLFFHFDSINIPSTEEMERQYGSIEEWQRAKTIEWISKLQEDSSNNTCIVFEGKMRITFLKEVLHKHDLSFAQNIQT